LISQQVVQQVARLAAACYATCCGLRLQFYCRLAMQHI